MEWMAEVGSGVKGVVGGSFGLRWINWKTMGRVKHL